jgi:S1-C subfamily serine protease
VPVDPAGVDSVPVDEEAAEEADDGVFLLVVKRGTAADQAGLRAGDVILSFGGVRTRTFEELQDAVRQAGGPVQVVFVNGENGQIEYSTVVPQEGRIGVTCE